MDPLKNVKSAQRVLDILEHFNETRRGQGVSEIAKALGLPVSSCFAVLRTMVASDILFYDETTKTYRPTTRLRTLTDWLVEDEPLQEKVKYFARRLYRELGAPVAVSRRCGLNVEWLYTLKASLAPGQLRPICKTINGLALLSRMSDHEIREIVDGHNACFGRDGGVVFSRLLERVNVARTTAYASGCTPIDPRFAAICFLISDQKAGEELLLTVQLPAAELRLREQRVVHAARRLIPELLGRSAPGRLHH